MEFKSNMTSHKFSLNQESQNSFVYFRILVNGIVHCESTDCTIAIDLIAHASNLQAVVATSQCTLQGDG